MSHDSGWGYFSDGNSYAGVCKQRKGKWACLQYTKELRNQQSSKTALEMSGQSRISRYGKDLNVDRKKHFGFTVDAIVIFLQHGVAASEKRSSEELEICSKLQNGKSLFLYKYLTSPIIFFSSDIRKVAHCVPCQSRNHTSYFHILFSYIRPTFTYCPPSSKPRPQSWI